MSEPLLSVIIPTCGRDTLERTLRSMRCQAPARDLQLLVIADTHAGTHLAALDTVPALCARYEAICDGYDGGQHCVGQPQRNYGMTRADGAWLAFSQDDAAWTLGAWDAIAASIARPPRCPRLFRVQTWQAGVVPRVERVRLANVDADCIVVPNVPNRLGLWGLEYCGDFTFIRDTVLLWGQVVWEPQVIALGRPDPRRQFGGLQVAG
jgi:hypothetical protein